MQWHVEIFSINILDIFCCPCWNFLFTNVKKMIQSPNSSFYWIRSNFNFLWVKWNSIFSVFNHIIASHHNTQNIILIIESIHNVCWRENVSLYQISWICKSWFVVSLFYFVMCYHIDYNTNHMKFIKIFNNKCLT